MKIKKKLRAFFINLTAFWLATEIIQGFQIQGGYQGFLVAALVLTFANFTIKPLIKLLLLPVNLITLGSFRWLVNVLTLYLVTLIVPQIRLVAFNFPGFSYQGFVAPPIHLNQFWVLVLASLIISFTSTFLYWLCK